MTAYPHNLDTRPLTTWPGELTPEAERRRAPFRSTLIGTMRVLTHELFCLGAINPLLEVAISKEQWSRDGRGPLAGAREIHPGVVLSLPASDVGALRYSTDTFTTWQDNLRAVALGLEALRKVDRYGITKRGEQYAGFKQIGGAVAVEPTMSVDDAARVIAQAANLLSDAGARTVLDPVTRVIVWRDAVKRHHPDRGGDPDAWHRLEQAKRVLDEHGDRS